MLWFGSRDYARLRGRLGRWLVWLAAATPLPGVAAAQPGGPAEARRALLEAVEAHGGRGSLESFGDAAATGTIRTRRSDGEEECAISVKSRGLLAFRSDVSCPSSGSHAWITDGRWGWTLSDGAKRPLGLEETADLPQVFNPPLGALGLFVRGRFHPASVRQTSQSLLVTGEAGESFQPDGSPLAVRPIEIELDAETRLVRSVRIWERGRDGRMLPEPAEYRYSDWREAAGLTVPFHVEEIRYGTTVSTVRFRSFSTAAHGDIFVEP